MLGSETHNLQAAPSPSPGLNDCSVGRGSSALNPGSLSKQEQVLEIAAGAQRRPFRLSSRSLAAETIPQTSGDQRLC